MSLPVSLQTTKKLTTQKLSLQYEGFLISNLCGHMHFVIFKRGRQRQMFNIAHTHIYIYKSDSGKIVARVTRAMHTH